MLSCDGALVVELLPDDRQMGEARDFLLFLGEPEFLPGFKEALIGVEANGEREITVAFPEDFGAKPLAGRSALYRVRVKEIQERLLPPLEGEFLKMLGVETEAALRQRTRRTCAKRRSVRKKAARRMRLRGICWRRPSLICRRAWWSRRRGWPCGAWSRRSRGGVRRVSRLWSNRTRS